MNRYRRLILIFAPVPIVGSSWALSTWVQSEPTVVAVRNDAKVGSAVESDAVDRAVGRFQNVTSSSAGLAADCQTSAERLQRDLGPECQIVCRPPFVLAGDLSQEELAAWHENTIAPGMLAMRRSYFQAEPNQPITVLLFRGEASYNRYCRRIYGDESISIYGYYKPNLRTLILNVSTGGGTLLHELTHALMDFDFPDVPDWLNEGLASLHEQCQFTSAAGGTWIEGLVNWRLKGLQEVARQGRLRSLASLIESTDFRGSREGTNYAQARYFCLYMQQRGVLEAFFRTFRDNHASDPHGRRAVASVFADRSWSELEEDFQRWMLALEPPRAGAPEAATASVR